MNKNYCFLLLGLIACTTACTTTGGDPVPEPEPGKPAYGLVSKVSLSNGGVSYDINMEYDDQNSIKKINYAIAEDGVTYNYTKQGDKLTVTVVYNDTPDVVDAAFTANFDNKGRIITAQQSYDKDGQGDLVVEKMTCQYADNGDLKLCANQYYESESKLVWADGNISKNETTIGGVLFKGEQFNSTYENRVNIAFSELVPVYDMVGILSGDGLAIFNLRAMGYLGTKDKFLPAKIVWTEADSRQMTQEYTYQVNDKGWPTTIVAKFVMVEGDSFTITARVTYKN